ncbi:MAG: hypothetical protein HY821_03180 [Acidobacteria bacterium]|nr:hypothetical protein [Acidobacteriota bacterium]
MFPQQYHPVKLILGAFLCLSCAGQETRGQADVAIQGFYVGGASDGNLASTGAYANFRYFYDKAGLLEARIESYSDSQRLNTGENFVRLSGLPWKGYRWTLTGGDTRLNLRPASFVASNLYLPEILLRGARVEANAGNWSASVFAGPLMIMQGPRMPYFRRTPQNAAGGGLLWKPRETVQVQTTLLSITSNLRRFFDQPYFLQPGRYYASSQQLLSNVTWKPRDNLTIFAESGLSAAQGFGTSRSLAPAPNFSASADYQSARWQVRASFVRQPASFLPLAGYFVGDRSGPYSEIHYQLSRRLNLFASASSLRNNIENRPDRASMRSAMAGGGFNAELPGRLSLMASYSAITLKSSLPEDPEWKRSGSRMSMLMLTRGFRRFSLRSSLRDLDTRNPTGDSRLRSADADASVYLGPLSFGGGVRLDQSFGANRRDALFYRGSFQFNSRRVSAYAFGDFGHDLLSQTLFVTSQIRTTVIGASARIDSHWTLNTELLRNTLATQMNDQNLFLISNAGGPISVFTSEMNRWTLFFRLTRSFHWGSALPDQFTRGANPGYYPVMGAVEGFVTEASAAGSQPAAAVPVTLDGYRTETTDQNGRYRFADVPQGNHKVALSERTLPAEFDPGSAASQDLQVGPRRTMRADFTVARLLTISGKLNAPAGIDFTQIVIRLAGSKRYTTPDETGNFTFYNLSAGHYQLTLDPDTLPAGLRLTTDSTVPVSLRNGEPPPDILIGLERVTTPKPVRRIQLSSTPLPPTRQ